MLPYTNEMVFISPSGKNKPNNTPKTYKIMQVIKILALFIIQYFYMVKIKILDMF